MRVLFDENVPLPLRQFFSGDDVRSVQEMGWAGTKNGALLAKGEGEFEVLLLADKNLRYQQNLSGRRLAIVELPTNRWPALKGMAPQIVAKVRSATPGSYIFVDP